MQNQMQEAPLAHYKELYRELTPQEVTQRTGAAFDEAAGAFVLPVLGHTVMASWPDFSLAPAAGDDVPAPLLDFKSQLLAIRYLLEGKLAGACGKFLSYREIPWGEVYDKNFDGRCRLRLAYSFGAKLDAFKAAAAALGGSEQTLKDVSFDMPFYGEVVIRLILWEADDEFPPSAQILFSDNTPQAFTAEDLAVAGEVVITALKAVAQ